MKVYVAGKFEEKTLVDLVGLLVSLYGHEVVSTWTKAEHAKGMATAAEQDLEELSQADAIVLVMLNPLPYKGTYTELGYALAQGKKIYVLGDAGKENAFVHLPCVQPFDELFYE